MKGLAAPCEFEQEIDRFDPNLPLGEAKTPPASWYTDPRALALEKETVFRRYWQFAGRTEQLSRPGDFFTGSFLGWPYVVTRDEEGKLNAFYNVCSHHGTCVARDAGNTKRLVCPYHGWAYGLNGQLKRAPKAGAIRDLSVTGLNLKPLPVQTWGPFVVVHFGKDAIAIAELLAGLEKHLPLRELAELRFVERVTYKIACNWKVFVDNYLDGGYHVPIMHPGLSAQLDLESYRTEMDQLWSIQSCSSGTNGGENQDDFKERLGDRARYAWIHPNFMINRYGPWMDTNRVIPLDEGHCLTVFDYYHEGPLSKEMLARTKRASDRVQQEDIEICHMVQEGLESGVYDQGIYAPRFEAPMYHFHKLLYGDFD